MVKETVNWSGAAGLFGTSSKSKGDGKWTWELSESSGHYHQAAGELWRRGCRHPSDEGRHRKDLPGRHHQYKTASKIADVVEFYKQQMLAKGWKLEGEPEVTDESATMEFTKGDQTAQVMLSADQGKTQVVINVTQ